MTGIPDKDKMHGGEIIIEERDSKQALSYRGIQNTIPQVKGIYPSISFLFFLAARSIIPMIVSPKHCVIILPFFGNGTRTEEYGY